MEFRSVSERSVHRAPADDRLLAGLFQVNALVHMIDPVEWNQVVLAARARVFLRKLNLALAFEVIDGADVPAVGTKYFHVLADLFLVHDGILLGRKNGWPRRWFRMYFIPPALGRTERAHRIFPRS